MDGIDCFIYLIAPSLEILLSSNIFNSFLITSLTISYNDDCKHQEDYILEVIKSDMLEPGDEDVFRKVKNDLSQSGFDNIDKEIRNKMNEFMETAKKTAS